MTKTQLLNSYSGETIEEHYAHYNSILEDDAHGLWVIVADGSKGFGLNGDDLIDYVRTGVRKMLEVGGLPVFGGVDSEHYWIYQPQYGTTHDEIVDNIVKEWMANGADIHSSGVWFAKPGYTDIDIAPWRRDIS